MWNRAELKERAKKAFKRNYWKCVLVAFILSALAGTGASNGVTSDIDTDDGYYEYYETENEDIIDGAVAKVVLGAIAVAGVISLALGIFVFNPLEIGGCVFFTNNTYTMAKVGDMIEPFKNGRYWESVKAVFLRNLFIFLWSLLLVVPGIIKSYEYRMITYLLAEHPEMSRKEAHRLSKEMMRGQKMDTFVLDLSFFGWYLLAAVTLGIVGIFYVAPYVHATNAELYLTLRDQYFYGNHDMNY